jgi:tectonic-1/3
MTSTVSYVAKPQDKVSGVRKPAPPLLTPLPEDIFYPFVTSSADSSVTMKPWVVGMSIALALLAMLLQASLA